MVASASVLQVVLASGGGFLKKPACRPSLLHMASNNRHQNLQITEPPQVFSSPEVRTDIVLFYFWTEGISLSIAPPHYIFGPNDESLQSRWLKIWHFCRRCEEVNQKASCRLVSAD